MNDVLKTIFSRAGVKEYTSEVPGDETLTLLMESGAAAPNAFNRQAWYFTAVTSPEILTRIDQETVRCLRKNGRAKDPAYRPLYGAPALIILSSVTDNEFARQDCSCASENIALAAVSLGLAARYLDVPNLAFRADGGLRALCRIPEGYQTVCFLSLGYPKDPAYRPTPKNPGGIAIVH